MIKKITLTDDLIKLIRAFKIQKFNFGGTQEPGYIPLADRMGWGIDQYSLWGGSYALEDMSYVLGIYDKHIIGTEEEPLGVRFDDETEDYLWKQYYFIVDNMDYILSLVF